MEAMSRCQGNKGETGELEATEGNSRFVPQHLSGNRSQHSLYGVLPFSIQPVGLSGATSVSPLAPLYQEIQATWPCHGDWFR